MSTVTQQDGPNPPDSPPNAGSQRERRWPSVADVDWWRDETSEYVPVRRPPAEPPRDPEIDFDLDEPGAPPPPAGTQEAATTEVVETEIVETGAVGAGVVDAEVVDTDESPAPATPTSSAWAAAEPADAPADPPPAVDQAVDQPVDRAVDRAVDSAVEEPVAPEKSGGIGRSASPYARPPRVTRREVAPLPRRVMPIPPAIITAPTPPPGPESLGPESLVEGAPSDVESTVTFSPPEAGLSLFDSTDVGAIPALPRPRRQPAPPPPSRRPRRVRRNRPGRAWIGLPALLVLLLAAAFVAWVSAEPLWLDAGHGTTGTATVVAKTDRCRVTFAAAGGGFTTSTVDLAGVDLDQCAVGATIAAQMVANDGARAYVVDRTGLRLRWAVGLGVLLLCGWGIAWATGAGRFRGWQRLTAIAMSLSAPLLIGATMLAITY